MERMIDKIESVAYHRNGISGAGFHLVIFESENQRLVGIVFDKDAHVAVTGISELGKGNAGDTYRGDHFESELRQAVEKYEDERKLAFLGR